MKKFLVLASIGPDLEIPIRNLFIIEDNAGITRGFIQASASGLIAPEP